MSGQNTTPNNPEGLLVRYGVLIYLAFGAIVFFATLARYDITHWDQIKARDACEAVQGRIWVDGPDVSHPACVKEVRP